MHSSPCRQILSHARLVKRGSVAAGLTLCTAAGRPVHITLSHKLFGRLGLLEREAAAALNASLAPLAAAVIPQYAAALGRLGLHAPLYITGNGGTLMSAAAAQEHPVLTVKSGPVNSVRGAAFLAGRRWPNHGTTTQHVVSVTRMQPPVPAKV
ncbi:hypothetical protein COO60DRAFT_1068052 [Scenedesmus sp. NREL 46B-D3]|nr:hypothetical protein COO60DRAFT_1068052 [Scenedesmus sp. NREL 46B-D3]